MEYINTRLPAGSTVQFLWEPRTYYSQRPARPDPILGVFKHEAFLRGNADEIAGVWREQGITHVLFWHAGFDFLQRAADRRFVLSGEEAAIWDRLRNGYLLPLYRDDQGAYILYELSTPLS
ncbi:MAG: hypothetical protein HYZ68_03780 [Chloroflexi bacterium]|nr:hypothetical protein [Chloroflexota bacterium]